MMTVRIAINGFGRIGRNVLRALYESPLQNKIEIVAINDLSRLECDQYLLQYDSVHGRFSKEVTIKDGSLHIDQQKIITLMERDVTKLPWKELDIDVVMECSGVFASRERASLHLQAGAKKVLISAPAGDDVKTIVFGVNDHTLTADDTVVSNASCTTNCLAPMIKPLLQEIGIIDGFMTTIHAVTNDQKVSDACHKDLRRARSALQSMIPTKTGAAAAVGLVIPELAGKLDGYAVRVPVVNVSMVDFTFTPAKATTAKEVNAVLKHAAENELAGILGYSDAPLVSCDFNHCAHSSTVDSLLTKTVGGLVKCVSWYDNEWGFSNRMLDTAVAMMEC